MEMMARTEATAAGERQLIETCDDVDGGGRRECSNEMLFAASYTIYVIAFASTVGVACVIAVSQRFYRRRRVVRSFQPGSAMK
jgi:hypothetical protein